HIDLAVEERHEFIRRTVPNQAAVQFRCEIQRRFGRERSYGCLDVGHQQSGRYAFARYVRDADSKLVWLRFENVEIVAAQGPKRLRSCRDLETGKLGNALRE